MKRPILVLNNLCYFPKDLHIRVGECCCARGFDLTPGVERQTHGGRGSASSTGHANYAEIGIS